jgi:hypothetical protein
MKYFFVLLLICLSWGCTSDERLVQQAQQSLETQRQQNEMLSRQSLTVVQQSEKLAHTAEKLVEQDALARREILAAHRDVQTEMSKLDDERRELQLSRQREPYLLATFQMLGTTLLCLLPLLLAGMAIRNLQQQPEITAELNELLIAQVQEQVSLLPSAPAVTVSKLEVSKPS